MTTTKTILRLVAALSLATLAACGDNNNNNNGSPDMAMSKAAARHGAARLRDESDDLGRAAQCLHHGANGRSEQGRALLPVAGTERPAAAAAMEEDDDDRVLVLRAVARRLRRRHDDRPEHGPRRGGGGDLAVADLAVQRSLDVPLTFQAEGLWWDSATQALYIANDAASRSCAGTSRAPSFSVVARLPEIAASAGGLGQLTKNKDESWLVTRFGFGLAGAVLQVATDGTVSASPGSTSSGGASVSPSRADGTIYDGWFVVVRAVEDADNGHGVATGARRLGRERRGHGIGKPVGVLAFGDRCT